MSFVSRVCVIWTCQLMEICIVMCAQDDMELTFKENQTFVVDALLSEDESYWWGTLNDKIGVFPSDTVQVLTGRSFPSARVQMATCAHSCACIACDRCQAILT
jgi:hypothetical protein